MSLLVAIAIVVIFAVILALAAIVLVQLKQDAAPGSPVDEFCGGVEGLDEIHTLFDGVYARWNGVGPWSAPPDLPQDESRGVWERERRYAKLGWLITDIMLRAWNWAYSLVPKRFRGQ